MHGKAQELYEVYLDEQATLDEQHSKILNQQATRHFELVGNPSFYDWSVSDWTDSWNYKNGESTAP